MSPHPTWIEIDLGQFRKNLTIIQNNIGKSLFCLVVKGNAYGHGIVEIGQAAVKAGVDYLGVSCLQEGVKLREAKIEIPILVMGAIHEDQVEDLLRFNLEFTISSKHKAEMIARHKKKCRLHIEVDTGMQRTGMRAATAIELVKSLKEIPYFELVGIYSHLATGDSPEDLFAKSQLTNFQEMLKNEVFQEKKWIAHMANSNGVVHFPQAHLDLVRPGLLAYGYLPKGASREFEGISPCFALKSKVSYFKVVAKGEGISYGHTYVTKQQTRIVTIPIGYGDGWRRSLSNRGSVLIRGKRFPIVGTICMDQFMVDAGDREVYVGDEVVLIGKQGNEEITLLEIAHLCDTIPYEILCQLNERIPRFYKALS